MLIFLTVLAVLIGAIANAFSYPLWPFIIVACVLAVIHLIRQYFADTFRSG